MLTFNCLCLASGSSAVRETKPIVGTNINPASFGTLQEFCLIQ